MNPTPTTLRLTSLAAATALALALHAPAALAVVDAPEGGGLGPYYGTVPCQPEKFCESCLRSARYVCGSDGVDRAECAVTEAECLCLVVCRKRGGAETTFRDAL